MAAENDIVLIYLEDQPLVFARIESILPDSKPDWYHVTLLMLQIPLQVTTWILKDVYINGDVFTMNGKAMRLEKVIAPVLPEPLEPSENGKEARPKTTRKQGKGNIISFRDFKKDD